MMEVVGFLVIFGVWILFLNVEAWVSKKQYMEQDKYKHEETLKAIEAGLEQVYDKDAEEVIWKKVK